MVVGEGLNSTGIFNQSGGTLTATVGVLEIGLSQATGSYTMTNQASVTLGVGSTMYIGDGVGGSGLLHVSDSSTFTNSGQTFIGTNGGIGTILQDGTGSVVTFKLGGSTLIIGMDPASTGNYDLSAGTFNLVSGAVSFGGKCGEHRQFKSVRGNSYRRRQGDFWQWRCRHL